MAGEDTELGPLRKQDLHLRCTEELPRVPLVRGDRQSFTWESWVTQTAHLFSVVATPMTACPTFVATVGISIDSLFLPEDVHRYPEAGEHTHPAPVWESRG